MTVTTVKPGPSIVRAGPSGCRGLPWTLPGALPWTFPGPSGCRAVGCPAVGCRAVGSRVAGPGRDRGCSATDGVWTSPARAVAGGALPSGWRLPGRSGAGSRVPVVRAVRNGGYLLAGCWLTPHRFDKFSKPLNHAGSSLPICRQKGRVSHTPPRFCRQIYKMNSYPLRDSWMYVTGVRPNRTGFSGPNL